MKPLFLLFVSVTLITGNGCKKNKQENNPDVNPPTEKKWKVTTVAGSGEYAFADGPVSAASFKLPEDVVITADGTIYVADMFNSRIRKISGGQVSTFAGNSSQNIVNGIGAAAGFIYPNRIVITNGNFYTLDGVDARVRKISSIADVFTYAGIATSGFRDGRAVAAQFKEGSGGIAADAQGNIYISDTYNNRIRKITVAGDVITIAGSGVPGFINAPGTAAQFNHPSGIAVDRLGNLYVLDNRRIRKITPDGMVAVFAGSGVQGDEDGLAIIAQFNQPLDIVIDDQGNLYVSDNHRIRKISTDGIVSTIAGSTPGYKDGDGSVAKFQYPAGMDIDAQGNIYVADISNNRIRKISIE